VSTGGDAWFSALGEPLDESERTEIDAYLSGLGFSSPIHRVSSWQEAFAVCTRPAEAWWNAEEAERSRLEARAHLDPADPEWLALNEGLHGAYQARLAQAAGAGASHPFLRKYALYCGGRWPLGVYEGQFAIF
jgi:hypothetical protein